MSTMSNRRLHRGILSMLSLVLAVAGLAALSPAASAAEVGFVGPTYGGNAAGEVPPPPTEQKAQSKLWHAQGSWWGALWDEGTGKYMIWRYDWSTNTWTNTGTALDTRARTDMDVLWDGSHLYVLSNGTAANSSNPDAELSRYSYSNGSYTQDWAPVKVVKGVTYSPVIEKDSTGRLWMTYTTGNSVMVTHSTTDDKTWVAPYLLPTPNGESDIHYDPTISPDDVHGSSDISSVVALDGNRIGVMWSNQNTMKMYWAIHQDGAGDSDTDWTLDVAYDQPKGADDHINLKSVAADPSGLVFAVTKTSMTGAGNPLINVLRLGRDGTWSSYVAWRTDEDLTRAVLLIDKENRQLYVFAAGPTNDGGSVYFKKTSMANPSFTTGLGTPFIESSSYLNINNPTTTKQPVDSTTGLLVLAADHPTKTYLYNRIALAASAPADTTAPDTTITKTTASDTSTSASFTFTSSEAGSTFECKLEPAGTVGTFSMCTTPQSYAGLVPGTYTFSVRAVDAAKNTDATPASYTWAIADTTAPDTTITETTASGTSTSASFTFTSSEAGSTFECKLEPAGTVGTFSTCTTPKSYTGLAPGTYTFSVRAVDAAKNPDATPASHTWTIQPPAPQPGGGGTGGGGGGGGGGGASGDTTPPDTTITAQPTSSTTQTTASFSFTATEAGSTFTCRLDGGQASPCASPKSYSGLAVGAHTFSVAATDGAGNGDPTPATATWMVTAPTGTVPHPVFADDFSNGLGAWRQHTSGDGVVGLAAGAVHPGDLGAALRSTGNAGSEATMTARFGKRLRDLRIDWTAMVARNHRGDPASQLLTVRDARGRAVLTVLRKAGSGRLVVRDLHGRSVTTSRVRLGAAAKVTVLVTQRRGAASSWQLLVNGHTVAADRSASTGHRAVTALTFGDRAGERHLDYRIDDVEVWRR